MISELKQEQAALYALGLLDVDEAIAFEQYLEADSELHEVVRELQETAALLAMASEGETVAAPAALRERVLAEVYADGQRQREVAGGIRERENGAKKASAIRMAWLPWAIAALFMGCAGALLWEFGQAKTQIFSLRSKLIQQEVLSYARNEAEQVSSDHLARVSFCVLEPTPDFAAQPRAAVIWDAAHRQGKLRVNRLAPPAEGKDYQLWTVEAGRKEPVSAGVVHVDADGKADIPFQPVDADGKPVVAVAISLEQAGGSPTNKGPILLLGKF